MSTKEWIDKVVINNDDNFQKEAIERELNKNIAKLSKNSTEEEVLLKLGDPEVYYQKHFDKKSSKKFNLIIGSILTVVGFILLVVTFLNRDSELLHQIRIFPDARNNIFYGSGVVLAIGVVTLKRVLTQREVRGNITL